MRCFTALLLVISFCSDAIAFRDETTTDEVTELKARIELLEAQLKAVTLERDALQKQIDSESEGPGDKKNDSLPLGSVWKGKFVATHLGKTSTSNAECRITARDGKTLTFLQTIENGAVWEFDCAFTGSKRFKIVAVRRVRAADAVVDDPDLPSVGGVSGGGNADEKKVTLQFVWRDAQDGPLSGKFELKPEE